ncbi:MAG: TIGR03619 family F420-dependent LLM class oxidoreductase [Chloroflexi bacterium]|nr:TIGR03619 family F420-dependent LLM class oxidoreductase [Chloroflexota bacterium]
MQFGICVPHYGRPIDVGALRDLVVAAEDLGFASVWVTDHLIVPADVDIVYRHDMLDPLAVLAYAAAVTRRVRLGTSVIILPYRNPIVVAKLIATADQLSGGRVVFGAGVGWMEREFGILGVPFHERGAMSDEYLQLMIALWTTAPTSFHGKYFAFENAQFSPRPVQQPHPPIWIGGRSRVARRRAVRYGAVWHPTLMTPAETAEGATDLRALSAQQGRPEPPAIAMRGTIHLGSPATDERRPLQGSAEQIAQDLAAYADAGLSELLVDFPGRSIPEWHEQMRRFADEFVK